MDWSGCLNTLKIIQSRNCKSAELYYLVKNIFILLNGCNFHISHILREGNKCTDWLANKGCYMSQIVEITDWNTHLELICLIKMDKWGLPYIRKYWFFYWWLFLFQLFNFLSCVIFFSMFFHLGAALESFFGVATSTFNQWECLYPVLSEKGVKLALSFWYLVYYLFSFLEVLENCYL